MEIQPFYNIYCTWKFNLFTIYTVVHGNSTILQYILYMEIQPFNSLGPQREYLGEPRPMLLCVTLCSISPNNNENPET